MVSSERTHGGTSFFSSRATSLARRRPARKSLLRFLEAERDKSHALPRGLWRGLWLVDEHV
uniref:Uncharacterized protein n=1 Tax=Brassica oleracea var. oleracea TaxID=109376 RepID=A0A0D3B800_BRAOL